MRTAATIRTQTYLLFASLLFMGLANSSTLSSHNHSTVEIRLERNERVGADEVHFRLKVANRSNTPVYLTGIVYQLRSTLFPIYLEQEQATGEWKIVLPCIDTPPPQVIKLDDAKPMNADLVLKVPLGGTCKERNIKLEGRFRFRLDYFDSEVQTQDYLNKFLSEDKQESRAKAALSEPFEIPPFELHAPRLAHDP